MLAAGDTVVAHHGATDPRTGVWTETSSTSVAGVGVAWSTGVGWSSVAEATAGQDLVVINATLYAPVGADITATDLVTIGAGTTIASSDVYEVVGAPADWRNPLTGWHPGYLVIRLVLHEG